MEIKLEEQSPYFGKKQAIEQITQWLSQAFLFDECDPLDPKLNLNALINQLYGYKKKEDGSTYYSIIPYNAASGRLFDILNHFLLSFAAKNDPRWMSFEQAKKRDFFLLKKSKSIKVFMKTENKNEEETQWATRVYSFFSLEDFKKTPAALTLNSSQLANLAGEEHNRLSYHIGANVIEELLNYSSKALEEKEETEKHLTTIFFVGRKMAEFMQPSSLTTAAFAHLNGEISTKNISSEVVDHCLFNANRLSYQFDKEFNLKTSKEIANYFRTIAAPYRRRKTKGE